MTLSNTLTASLEDYLKAIFQIISEKQGVKPRDIAKRLHVANSSVTGALRALAEKKLINYAPYDVITLTSAGEKTALDVLRRHEALRDFFMKVLAVEYSEAEEAACRMEHAIPKAILERFIDFANFVDVCPRAGNKWIKGFGYYCDHADTQENCENCISDTLDKVKERRERGGRMEKTTVKLRDLKPGQKGKVVKIKAVGQANRRMIEMGVTPGTVVKVESIAPLGDPIKVKVKGYHLSLRKNEAEGIEIEAL